MATDIKDNVLLNNLIGGTSMPESSGGGLAGLSDSDAPYRPASILAKATGYAGAGANAPDVANGEGAGGGGSGDLTIKAGMSKVENLPERPTPHDPNSAADTKGVAQENYTNPERAAMLGRVRGTGEGLLAGARSAEQQLGNYAYQDENLAKNNPRGNLNNMGYKNTLHYSRLADIINNKAHFNPGSKPLIMAGGQVLRDSDEASVERWQPIETQEMRQMRANEELDKLARKYGVDLQGRIQEYPQVVQELIDKATLDFADFLERGQDEILRNLQNAIIRQQYEGTFQQFLQMRYEDWIKKLDFSHIAGMGDWLMSQSPMIATYLGAALGNFPQAPGIINRMFEGVAVGAIKQGFFNGRDGVRKFAQWFEQFKSIVGGLMGVDEATAASYLLKPELKNANYKAILDNLKELNK